MREYKGFNVGTEGTYSVYVVKAVGRGSVPVPLRGMFTSEKGAKQAIDLHLLSKKVTKDGDAE